MALLQARSQMIDLDINDITDLLAFELPEDDHLVNAVDKLGAETLLTQVLTGHTLHLFLIVLTIEFMQPEIADITGHDDHRIFEIDRTTLAIGEATIVEELQQDIEDLGSGLLDLIEQHNAIGMATHSFGQLSALFIANIAGRGANEARNRVLLHILGHVDAHHGLLIIEEKLGQGAGQLGFTDAGGPQEEEAGQRSVRIGENFQRSILANDALAQVIFHVEQLLDLSLHQFRDRDMGPL